MLRKKDILVLVTVVCFSRAFGASAALEFGSSFGDALPTVTLDYKESKIAKSVGMFLENYPHTNDACTCDRATSFVCKRCIHQEGYRILTREHLNNEALLYSELTVAVSGIPFLDQDDKAKAYTPLQLAEYLVKRHRIQNEHVTRVMHRMRSLEAIYGGKKTGRPAPKKTGSLSILDILSEQ